MLDDEADDSPLAVFAMDLRAVTGSCELRVGEEGWECVLAVSDGYTQFELTSRMEGRNEAAIQGSQRLATAAMNLGVGLLLFNLPDPPESPGEPGDGPDAVSGTA
jgi:hypothetical protein